MKKLTITLFTIYVALSSALAQTENTLYHSKFIPQRHLVNPAYQPLAGFHMGMEGAFEVMLPFSIEDFVDFSTVGDTSIISTGTGKLSGLNKSKVTGINAIGAFTMGFRASEQGYFTFSVRPKTFMHMAIPIGGMLDLFSSSKADLSNLGGKFLAYNEVALGFSHKSDNNITLGVKLKYLAGATAVDFHTNKFEITKSAEKWDVNMDFEFNTNLIDSIGETADGDPDLTDIKIIDFESRGADIAQSGTGFGLDIGIQVQSFERLSFSASLIDLGYINWSQDPYTYTAKGTYTYKGANLDSLLAENSQDPEWADSLQSYLTRNVDRSAFTTFTPVQIFLGAEYNLTPRVGVGLVSRTQFTQKTVRQQFTLSLNTQLWKVMSFSPTVSLYNYNAPSWGFMLGARFPVLPFFHGYFIFDNLPIEYVDMQYDGKSIPVPYKMSSISLRFGCNIVFGYKSQEKKIKDKPLIY